MLDLCLWISIDIVCQPYFRVWSVIKLMDWLYSSTMGLFSAYRFLFFWCTDGCGFWANFGIIMTEVWCIWSGHLWKQIHSRIQAMEVKQEEVVHQYHQDGRVTSVLWLTDPFSMWTQMMWSTAYGTRFSQWRVILWRKPAITLTCTLASTSFLSSFPNAFL